jgi:polyhydroxyalkanoate synthesis regulator phasin
MEKPKDPLLQAIDAAFSVASSLIQNATNQLKDFSTSNDTSSVQEFDFEEVIEREGLVRQDELVRLRAVIGELKAQVVDLEEETKKLRKKLKALKEKS